MAIGQRDLHAIGVGVENALPMGALTVAFGIGCAATGKLNTLFTEAHGDSQLGEYFRVFVGGQRIGLEGSEDDLSAFSTYITIPKSAFNNPKGSYAIVKESEAKTGQATASYTGGKGSGQTSYASYHPTSPTQSAGAVEITDFEIGEQRVLGQPTGVEGYTKLSGTFQMNLYAVKESLGAPLKVTEGKFNLRSGRGLIFKTAS